MNSENIITSDKFLELSTNYISRKKTHIDITPEKNIFFVKTDFLEFFASNILPKIYYPFTLITHESDYQIPGNYEHILNNSFLKKWYGMNVHILHEKIQAIPIGLANAEWPHGNIDALVRVLRKDTPKTKLVYCNYKIETNTTERMKALKMLKGCDFIDFDFNLHSFEEYIEKLSSYKYVISPPGNSIDCHRVWESIYVKTVPICLKSLPMVYFKNCPILFINDWSQITETFLQENYNKSIAKSTELADFLFYENLLLNS